MNTHPFIENIKEAFKHNLPLVVKCLNDIPVEQHQSWDSHLTMVSSYPEKKPVSIPFKQKTQNTEFK